MLLLGWRAREPDSGLVGPTPTMPINVAKEVKFQPHTANEFELQQYLTQLLPCIEVVGSRWFNYNEQTGCWDDHTKDDFRKLALQIINPAKRRVNLAHRVLDHFEDTVRSRLDFGGAIRGESLDTVLINTQNKVLRVTPDCIKVLDHDRDFRFTRSLAVEYVPNVVNEPFLAQLPLVLPDVEDRDLYQLLGGNIFIPDARYEVFGVIYGEAGCGKDTIIGPISSLFGPTERGLLTSFSINQMTDPRSYALPLMQFAAVNICSELNSRDIEDSSVFKMLVSGVPISTRMLYEKPFSMTTTCKCIFLTNNMPDFRFGTGAEGRRARYIRPSFKPDKVDVLVKERLKVVHPGTLNWLLDGLQKLLRMGPQPMPLGGPESREVHARFTSSNDPIKDFVTTYCIMDRQLSHPKRDMEAAFSAYASDNNLPAQFTTHFLRMLYKRFPNVVPKRSGSDGCRTQMVSGLSLNEAGVVLAREELNDRDKVQI